MGAPCVAVVSIKRKKNKRTADNVHIYARELAVVRAVEVHEHAIRRRKCEMSVRRRRVSERPDKSTRNYDRMSVDRVLESKDRTRVSVE